MKVNGQERLQKFLKRVHANNTAQQRGAWVQPVTSVLQQELGHNVTRYHTQQCLNLDKVWKFVIQQLENAINHKQLLPLIKNIIRFVYLPDTLETFFSDDLESQHALLTLHTSVQTKVRHELVAGLDELFLGCHSASDFLEKEHNIAVYKVLDEIIRNINKNENQLQQTKPINIPNSSNRISSQSFSSLAAISLKQLTYISALVNQENIEKDEDCKVNQTSKVLQIPHVIMSREIIAELFQEKEQYQEPQWMFEGLTLSPTLIGDLKSYQDHLYKRFIGNKQPHSKPVEHKLAFLDTIIYQAEHKKLTPKFLCQSSL